MVSGIFVNESGRMLVSLFVWIGKRVTIVLPIFFYHKLAQSLLTMGFGLVVTPPGSQLKAFLRQFSPTTTKMVDILLATALDLVNIKHFKNWFTSCCYCTS
jgi:hypothetical protein